MKWKSPLNNEVWENKRISQRVNIIWQVVQKASAVLTKSSSSELSKSTASCSFIFNGQTRDFWQESKVYFPNVNYS